MAIALILASFFALCACGSTEVIEKEVQVEVPVVPEKYLKYEKLIDVLESGNYDDAQAIIEYMKPKEQPASPAPTPETPSVIEVQITKENFLDYFEYIEFWKGHVEKTKNSSGNVVCVTCWAGYYLKDGYTVPKNMEDKCTVEAGVKFVYHDFYSANLITADLENLAYTVKGRPSSTTDRDKMRKADFSHSDDGSQVYTIYIGTTQLTNDYANYGSTLIPEDSIELVSASGTLYLSNNG